MKVCVTLHGSGFHLTSVEDFSRRPINCLYKFTIILPILSFGLTELILHYNVDLPNTVSVGLRNFELNCRKLVDHQHFAKSRNSQVSQTMDSILMNCITLINQLHTCNYR